MTDTAMTNEEVRALIERLAALETGLLDHVQAAGRMDSWEYSMAETMHRAADALTTLLARAEAAESALATVRRGLREIANYADNTIQTASRDLGDWIDDVAHIGLIAIGSLAEQPKE